MADPRFVHLHVHTHYSLLDGANKVPDLIRRTKELGMDSIAITDHGALFGAVEFYNEAKKEGIKPIIGIEAYMAPGARTDRSIPSGNPGEAAYHLILLAQNAPGYKNLLKLASTAYRDGFYYKPRIDKEVLREHAEGLIATSACLGGEIPSALIKRDMKAAKQIAETYLQIFGPDRFFIEIQKHIPEQDQVNPELVELASKLGIGVVGTNDVHFLRKEDHFAHGVLCCISMGRLITDENRLKYSEELYLKSPAEMAAVMGQFPQALENTLRVAQMCELQLDFGKKYAPVYHVPEGKLSDEATEGRSDEGKVLPDDERYLRQLCEEGLDWRYGTRDVSPEIRARLEHELKIICMKNFCSYFLIVWDFCNYARAHGIPVGARGSGVGTMVGYLLGLCNVDPIRYGLLFERFMDPSRNEMPDIDIDICQDGRQKVIDYVRQKYGHVAQIITFGTLAAKAACKDVGRVLGVPLPEVDKLTKLIPGTPGMTLKKALAQVPELDKLYKENPQITQVIDIAQKLEGMCRNAGCHAAGVIIADQPIENIAPLYKDSDGNILTQFEGPIAEKVGLLKMDFLGLRTLSTLQRAIDLEFQTRSARGESNSDEATKRRSDEGSNPQSAIQNPRSKIDGPPSPPLTPDGKIDIERIDLADNNVLALFCRGETRGIFQFESGGMQDLLMKMQPDRVEDLIAANALYRPGPMELIPSYCARKHGKEPIPQVHPIVDKILEETYSIMVYQEQVMQIFNQLGGIELANAYKLIKAISKKQIDVIAKFQPEFIKGCMAKGVSKEKADELFDLILKFGGYGFNKCVVGRTIIIDAITGRRTTVEELFRVKQSGSRRRFTIHALGDDWKLHPRRVINVAWNGRKRVYQLRTAQGKSITATANHPFRTLDGWRDLADLRVGDRIAAPRRLPIAAEASWPRHQLIALAGLLSEGNTCHPTCLCFFGNEPQLVQDFAAAAGQFPATPARAYQRDDGRLEVCVSTGQDARFRKGDIPWNYHGPRSACATAPRVAVKRSGAFRWAENLGILNKKATHKFVPPEIFSLQDSDIEAFLGRLWAGDGFVANHALAVPYYATSSEQLARDVQTLLLRLGIVSGIHRKSFRYRGGARPGYTVHVVGTDSIAGFADKIAPHCLGREAAVQILTEHLEQTRRGLTSKDTVPAEVRHWVDEERRRAGLTWSGLEHAAGVSVKELVGRGSANKRGFRRATISRLAGFFGSQRLGRLADSDVFWDRVVSIEPMGVEDTYDLTVDRDHNFVADGLIVHNSHSTRYAIVAFQTAYMKVYHPVEYMAALLTYEMGSTEKVVEYIDECRRLSLPDGSKGVKVLPPDVNFSNLDFTPVYQEKRSDGATKRRSDEWRKRNPQSAIRHPQSLEGVIRFGLMAVKGIGAKPCQAIIDERAKAGLFKGLFEFCERVDLHHVTRSTLEALVKCGAFSSLGARRAQLLHILERAMEMGQQTQADKRNGQFSMFGAPESSGAAPAMPQPLPDIPELEPAELLKHEKELLGFYITSHPLTEHQVAIERYSTASTKDPVNMAEGSEVNIGGMFTSVRKKVTKTGRSAGQQMAIVTLEDLEGTMDGMIFADDLAQISQRYPDAVTPERIVFLKGKIDRKRENPCIIVTDIVPIEDAAARFTTSVVLQLDGARHRPDVVTQLKPLLAKHKGNTPVFAQVAWNGGQSIILKLNETGVKPSRPLVDDLELLLGTGQIQLHGAGSKRIKRLQQQRLFKEEPAEAEARPATDEAAAAEFDSADRDD